MRKISDADLPAVAALLSEGFPNCSKAYWLRGLKRHAGQQKPDGYPSFGFCLDNEGVLVGAILLLFSTINAPDYEQIRCNVSSWYVKPEFRSFGSLLITSATNDKNVTYFDITPAPHTWLTIEAQGFYVYCFGQIHAALALRRPVANSTVEVFTSHDPDLSPDENELLRQHANFGCLSLVIRCGDKCFPFVLQKQRVKGVLPIYRLIYCRDLADLKHFAGNLGRFLLWRGGLLVRFDSNAPVPGIIGWYSEKRGRKYTKGPTAPRLGDLSFTEAALFDS